MAGENCALSAPAAHSRCRALHKKIEKITGLNQTAEKDTFITQHKNFELGNFPNR